MIAKFFTELHRYVNTNICHCIWSICDPVLCVCHCYHSDRQTSRYTESKEMDSMDMGCNRYDVLWHRCINYLGLGFKSLAHVHEIQLISG